MEENKAVFGALLFIVLVIGANFVAYARARGAFRSDNQGLFDTLKKTASAAQKKGGDMEELRRKMEELEKGKKNDARESKP